MGTQSSHLSFVDLSCASQTGLDMNASSGCSGATLLIIGSEAMMVSFEYILASFESAREDPCHGCPPCPPIFDGPEHELVGIDDVLLPPFELGLETVQRFGIGLYPGRVPLVTQRCEPMPIVEKLGLVKGRRR